MAAARTEAEIIARIEELKSSDFFGFESGDLIQTLSFAAAKPFLKDGATEADWKPDSTERDAVIERIKSYLPFAWEKANGCRGLSAGRSISHMQAWLWLLREDAAAAAIDEYTHYGKPHLREISEAVGVDWRALDNGDWCNSEGDDGVIADDVPRGRLPFVSLPA
jgi:hypothetical protein